MTEPNKSIERIRQYIEARASEACHNICAVAYTDNRAHYLFLSDLRVLVQHVDALRVAMEHREEENETPT